VQLLIWSWSSNLILIGLIVSEILRFLYFAVLAWNCLFTPIWGTYFCQLTSPIVLTSKRHFFTRKHFVWAIKSENRFSGSTWARSREKKNRTGQDNQKKSQSCNISPIWETKICMVGSLPDVVTCAKFQGEILGVTILRGGEVEFPIFLLIFAWALQQCSATALPVRLHHNRHRPTHSQPAAWLQFTPIRFN